MESIRFFKSENKDKFKNCYYLKTSVTSFIFLLTLIWNQYSICQSFWTYSNGPFGGNIKCLEIDSSTGIIYAGGDGLFYTENDGENWIHYNNFPESIVNSIAIDKNGQILTATNLGIYRSTNKGENWILATKNLQYFTSICINIDGTIFADCGSLYRSTDNGETWELSKTSGASNAIGVNSLGHIFVGYSAYHSMFDYEFGIIRSTDNGATWDTLDIKYTASSYATNNKGEFFIGTYSNNIFRSSSDGKTWTQLAINLPNINYYDIVVYSLYINLSGRIYAGTGLGLICSDDDGLTWLSDEAEKWYLKVPSILSNSKGYIFAGTNGSGIFLSKDNGNSWNLSNNGLIRLGITSLAISKDDQIWVGTSSSGIFTSLDQGQNWTTKNSGLTNLEAHNILICNNGYIFTAISTGSGDAIYRSTDNGNHWFPIDSGLSEINLTCITENSNGIIYFGTINKGIFKSNDYGESWKATGEIPSGVSFLDIVSFPNGYIIASSVSNLFRSTNNGESWEQLSVTGINKLLITKTGKVLAGSAGLYYSSDYGNTWEISGLTDSVGVNCLAQNSIGYIFVGTSGFGTGLLCSKDDGKSWRIVSYNSVAPYFLAFDPQDNLWGGSDNGLFYNSNPTFIHSSEIIKYFSLKQNYPNPFNPTTTIEYSIPERTNVTLKIFDVLGREITTLVNEEKSAGNYKVEFSGTSLPSGIYFYRLEAGKFIETKKIILIK